MFRKSYPVVGYKVISFMGEISSYKRKYADLKFRFKSA